MLSSSFTKISAINFKFFRVCAKKFFVLELRVSRDQLLVTRIRVKRSLLEVLRVEVS